MPYSTISELPEQVQGYPKHAKEIWLAAFNSAMASGKYTEKESFRVAWAALKAKYKIGG